MSFKTNRMMRKWYLLVVLVALLPLTAGPAFSQGPPIDPPGLEQAIEVQEAHTAALMAIDGVVGTGVGHGAEGRAAVFVFTAELGVAGIPNRLDGVPVVAHVTGEIFALHHRLGHNGGPGRGGEDPPDPGPGDCSPTETCERPVPIGVSSGSERLIRIDGEAGEFCTTGTLGFRGSGGDRVFAVSNAHVFALEGSIALLADEGESENTVLGDAILQPGRVDMTQCGTWGEINAAVIGILTDFVPIQFDSDPNDNEPGPPNTIDAAIAATTTDDVGISTPSNGYGTPKMSTVEAAINMKVKKYGRTTGQTKGQVFAINATFDITYDIGVARFVKQIVITPGSFSAAGDSGSLIVVDGKGRNKGDDRKPVGLLFAGGINATIANPIALVLERFDISIDGE